MPTSLAYGEHGSGPLLLMLPGAGDLRSEYRHSVLALAESGWRVVTADLPGHGESPTTGAYGVTETAAAIIELIDHLGGGPAMVVGTSFAPPAALIAASEAPDRIRALVAISPHMTVDPSVAARLQAIAVRWLLRGRWAGPIWGRLYRSWYKTSPPADLEEEVRRIQAMLNDRGRRRAVRETLTSPRPGVEEKLDEVRVPTLVVYGTEDDHFSDPIIEGESLARRLGGELFLVQGAGHYPHVEQPELFNERLIRFLAEAEVA